MKKFFSIFTLVLLITSCSQEREASNLDNPELDLKVEKFNIDRQNLDVESKLIFREGITCQGTCDGTTTACQVIVPLDNPNVAECSCEGCELHIIFDRNNGLSVGIDNNQTFILDFIDYVRNDFQQRNLNKLSLNEILIEDYTDVRIIVYEYINPMNEIESVMLVKKKDENGQMRDPTIIVDCTGGCNAPGETCRERYIIATGDVECTCEGTCVMEISEKQ